MTDLDNYIDLLCVDAEALLDEQLGGLHGSYRLCITSYSRATELQAECVTSMPVADFIHAMKASIAEMLEDVPDGCDVVMPVSVSIDNVRAVNAQRDSSGMKTLLITGCSDPLRWYAGMIGQQVPYLGDVGDEYKSREPDGFVNFVQYADAQVVEEGEG